MSTPNNQIPLQEPTGDPKAIASDKDAVTNSDETNKIVNQDNVVADTEGIETTLSDSEPSTALNADRDVTNSEAAGTDDNPVVN